VWDFMGCLKRGFISGYLWGLFIGNDMFLVDG
jgi:hypothetical protein